MKHHLHSPAQAGCPSMFLVSPGALLEPIPSTQDLLSTGLVLAWVREGSLWGLL